MFELQHVLVGLLPAEEHKFSLFWLTGSLIPDLDHLAVLYQHKIFSWRRVVEVMKDEDKYHLRFKTKYGHSIFGALIASLPVLLISRRGALYFFLAYLLHLLMDWPDRDEKQYFYPFNFKVRGWLPIMSRWEILFSFCFALLLIFSYWK